MSMRQTRFSRRNHMDIGFTFSEYFFVCNVRHHRPILDAKDQSAKILSISYLLTWKQYIFDLFPQRMAYHCQKTSGYYTVLESAIMQCMISRLHRPTPTCKETKLKRRPARIASVSSSLFPKSSSTSHKAV